MGLDLVEFVLAVEDSFQLSIPDADASHILTPGELVDYLVAHLPLAPVSQCLDQLAFYSLRRAATRVLGRARHAIKPDSRWDDLLPRTRRRRYWQLLHHATGTSKWPGVTPWGTLPKRFSTVGGTARYLATYAPGGVNGARKQWTRAEIKRVIKGLMAEQFAISEFDWDQRFVRDLGLN